MEKFIEGDFVKITGLPNSFHSIERVLKDNYYNLKPCRTDQTIVFDRANVGKLTRVEKNPCPAAGGSRKSHRRKSRHLRTRRRK